MQQQLLASTSEDAALLGTRPLYIVMAGPAQHDLFGAADATMSNKSAIDHSICHKFSSVDNLQIIYGI